MNDFIPKPISRRQLVGPDHPLGELIQLSSGDAWRSGVLNSSENRMDKAGKDRPGESHSIHRQFACFTVP